MLISLDEIGVLLGGVDAYGGVGYLGQGDGEAVFEGAELFQFLG